MKKQNKQQSIELQVTEGLSVAVFKDSDHKFLMDGASVSLGYGIAVQTLRSVYHRHKTEFKENKHFVKGVAKCNTLANAQPHQVFWTKSGVVRLGFFIKSERAKLFRDWAEQVLLEEITAPEPLKHLPSNRRNHNRLTQDRLLSIMSDVVQIEDKDLRLRITQKLEL